MNNKLLIIDDDKDICEVLEVLLSAEGFEVLIKNSGIEGLRYLEENQVVLIILDIMMPNMSGFETCEGIRRLTLAPILFVSAKLEIEDKEKGFLMGGDDYITKPFNPEDLIRRSKSLIRRYLNYQGSHIDLKNDLIEIRDLKIDMRNKEVKVGNNPINLRYMEYKILVLLATNRNQIFSTEEIYEIIWNEKFVESSNNAVVAHIKNLRKKIEKNPKEPKYIRTIWGRGYRMD